MRSRFRGKRKRSRQKELVEIQIRTLAMDYWSVLEYHIYCLDFKNKIQAVNLIPACHWQIIIDSFGHQNLVRSIIRYGRLQHMLTGKVPHT